METFFPMFLPVDSAAIEAEIDRQLSGRLSQFNVDCDDEGLVLSGTAQSFYVKQLAQHAVGRLTRLPIVRNEIQVLES